MFFLKCASLRLNLVCLSLNLAHSPTLLKLRSRHYCYYRHPIAAKKKGSHKGCPLNSGAGKRSRTPDLRITNALLYQLSYAGNTSFSSLQRMA